jgi:hypothetical protein
MVEEPIGTQLGERCAFDHNAVIKVLEGRGRREESRKHAIKGLKFGRRKTYLFYSSTWRFFSHFRDNTILV